MVSNVPFKFNLLTTTTGLIKSDTDHRIFRDVGDTAGFDFAFLEKTHLYHTPGDRLSAVRAGSLQTSGDNLLPFVMAFAKSPPLESGGVSLTGAGAAAAGAGGRRPRQRALTWFAPPGASTYVLYGGEDVNSSPPL